jgi:hypothetical protein
VTASPFAVGDRVRHVRTAKAGTVVELHLPGWVDWRPDDHDGPPDSALRTDPSNLFAVAAEEYGRGPAQFFFEMGFGACYAEATIRNGNQVPFPLTDAEIERQWAISREAYHDPAEQDAMLARLSATSPDAGHLPTFDDAWAAKEAEGYRYGRDALENVRFGWELALAAVVTTPAGRLDDSEGASLACIETMPMWAVGVVTDGTNAAVAQKAETDFDGHYFAVDPEDALEWEPTHWSPLTAHTEASKGAGAA